MTRFALNPLTGKFDLVGIGGGGNGNSFYEQPVSIATTTNLTATYNNGTAGTGATLTNSGAQAAFESDGVTPSVNSRVLVKDQTDETENGIYIVTVAGDGSTNWVLTRATDYNQPSEINFGDLVAVIQGDTQASTIWSQNENVTTIGTDDITFSLFQGNSGASLSPYIVGNINADHTTINAAVTQASSDLSTNQAANVIIKPKGSPYSELINGFLGLRYINFVGFSAPNPLNGNHLANSTYATSLFGCQFELEGSITSFNNIYFDSCRMISNFSKQIVSFSNCILQSSDFEAPAASIGFEVRYWNCSFQSGAFFIDSALDAGTTTIIEEVDNCVVNLSATTTASKSDITFRFKNSQVIADFEFSGTSDVLFFDVNDCYFEGDLTASTADNIVFKNCYIDGAFDIQNSTTYRFEGCTFSDNVTFTNDQPVLIGCQNASCHRKVTTPAGDYTTLVTDEIIAADTSATRTISLYATPYDGMTQSICDIDGTASSNTLTVDGNGKNILGVGSVDITADFGAVKVTYFSETDQWHIVP